MFADAEPLPIEHPRWRQGEQPLPGWCGGLAWSELCGAFVISEWTRYAGLTAAQPAELLWTSAL